MTYCQRWKKAENKYHEIIQVRELTNKDFKAATINLFKDLMETVIMGNLRR